MARQRSKLVNFRFSDQERSMIEEMTTDPDMPTLTAVVRKAVRNLYDSHRRKTLKKEKVAS